LVDIILPGASEPVTPASFRFSINPTSATGGVLIL